MTPTQEKTISSLAVDVFENDTEILLVADVPGVSADKLDASIERDRLRLFAERSDGSRAYERTLRVPKEIDQARVSATLKDGVVTVRLPKAEAAKAKKIPIGAS